MCWQAWDNGLSAYLALTATEFEISGVLSQPSLAAALSGNGSWQARPCSLLCTSDRDIVGPARSTAAVHDVQQGIQTLKCIG